MNVGGDPERDDYGLPPVDVEIPDDARELDRDVQAYHRELRALRWRRITYRLHTPLTREGLALPLLAGCLALALVAGTLLTVFTAREATGPVPGDPGQPLPDAIVLVDGVRTQLRDLRMSVLALIPPRCGCVHLRQLASEGSAAGVQVYLVGTRGASVTTLGSRPGLSTTMTMRDVQNTLTQTYQPTRLTAVLVDANGYVQGVLPDMGDGFQLTGAMRALISGSAQALAPQRPARLAAPSQAGPL